MTKRLLAVVTLFIALLVALPAHAVETNATLKGAVVDLLGLPVPNAGLTLESDALLGPRTLLTGDDGKYRFTALPPGDYDLTVEHPSFAKWTTSNIKVPLGATLSIDVTLQLIDEVGETITVYEDAPVIDTESTSTGVVLDAQFLKDIPTGRDYQSAVQMTPGVVGGGNPNVHGGFDSGNQYYIDGVNTTDPLTSTFSMNMNFDAIDEIQIITGGMDAEYGRALGGAVNIVTKSGGNEFEGMALMTYSHPSFIIAPTLEGDSEDDNLEEQLVLNLGGPIKRDRAWFFLSFQGDRLIRTSSFDPEEILRDLETYPMAPRDWRSMYLYGKVTWQPSDDHRLWFHLQADPTWIDNVEQDPYTLPDGETVQNQSGWLGSIGHTYTPSNALLVESQAYVQKSTLNYFPILWKDCREFDARGACTDDFVGQDFDGQHAPIQQGWFANDADGFSAGPFPYASFNRRWRVSANTSATLWFDLAGEHQVKVGAQYEYLSAYYVYPGIENGYAYYNHDGDPTNLDGYTPAQLYRYTNDWESTFRGTMASVYIQDVYKPFPRLTLRPGIRLDAPALRDDVGRPVFNNKTLAPRLGIAYDLTGDGKTSVHAYYGRFYDSGFLVISDLLRQKSSAYGAYGWDEDRGEWMDDPLFEVSDTFLKAPDLKNPYSDEVHLGVSRQVGRDFGLDATFIYEASHRFWEDDEVNLIWNDDGSQVIGYRNGENVAIYRLRTPDDTFVRYTSVELTLTKAFSENWGMLGSYTWSRSYGTNSADQATFSADIPEQRRYEIGLLDYDRTHVVKMSGYYQNPDAWRIGSLEGGYTFGWNSDLASGTPYRKTLWNEYYGDYVNYDGIGDGRYRLPMIASTDLRAGLTLSAGRTDWMLGVDVFNVFNGRTTTAVSTAYDPEAVGDEQPFGVPLDRQAPRRMTVILRGEF